VRVPPLILHLDDLAANVVFDAVGMERDVGTIERDQQLRLIGAEPDE
jgi:hypothetical protein